MAGVSSVNGVIDDTRRLLEAIEPPDDPVSLAELHDALASLHDEAAVLLHETCPLDRPRFGQGPGYCIRCSRIWPARRAVFLARQATRGDHTPGGTGCGIYVAAFAALAVVSFVVAGFVL